MKANRSLDQLRGGPFLLSIKTRQENGEPGETQEIKFDSIRNKDIAQHLANKRSQIIGTLKETAEFLVPTPDERVTALLRLCECNLDDMFALFSDYEAQAFVIDRCWRRAYGLDENAVHSGDQENLSDCLSVGQAQQVFQELAYLSGYLSQVRPTEATMEKASGEEPEANPAILE